MRIATSTIYNQQVVSIDNLSASYQNLGQQLSTGKSLNAPGDGPTVIGQDLTIAGTIAGENGDVTNASAATNELNFVDGTLASLTNILQQARSLTVSSATDIIPNGPQRQDQAKQVEGMLEQVIGLANSQYGNKFVFSGTAQGTVKPITPQGNPPQSALFSGNFDQRYTTINGQPFRVGTTMQQAFNFQAADGSSDVFQVLANLRNTMNSGAVVDASGEAVNEPGQTILGPSAGAAAATTLGGPNGLTSIAPQKSNVVLTPDNTGQFSININGVNAAGNAQSQTFTFTNATAIDDGTAASVVGQINAATANIGVTAAWNVAQQKLILTSVPNGGKSQFTIADVPSVPGGTTSNFLAVFHLQPQADTINNLSTQIGEIDSVLNSVLKTRADVGERIQSLTSQTTQISSQATDNTNIKSSLEDTDIGKATSQFTQVQTALQAAYAVTSRIEGKTLIDYLPA
jgi:flagellar hook-associated protein 3 FlgL